MHTATLQPKEDRRLLRGHLWAYRNEFKQLPDAGDGELVDVFASNRRLVGRGFYQAGGGIAVRILTRHQEDIDAEFFRQRLENARALRERLFPGSKVYRWIHGESDGLPGLVADRYGAVVCARTACSFYTQHAELLGALMLESPGMAGVVVETPSGTRTIGEVPESVVCDMDGVKLEITPGEGQKTGLFLDQRENAAAACRFARGARVLDAHCYVGAWSCRLARAGAASVLGVDVSGAAIARASENAERNGAADVCRFEEADVLEVLARGKLYDLVVLDPPALAKSRSQTKKALGLYHALNAAALQTLAPGGVLVTSSCSHFVDPAAFLEVLKRAAASARRRVSLLDMRGAAPDHPVLLSMPETRYLACAILRAD